jgi:hypothetical protein
LYISVYQKPKITNNIIQVNLLKQSLLKGKRGSKLTRFFAGQVSSMGIRGHKGKGGHVDKKGKKNYDFAIMSIGKMSAPFFINLDFPIMDEEEVTSKDYLDEDNSSQTLKKIKLVQLLDMKEKNIAIIQAYLIELKLEKERMSATVNKETKNLEYATQIHRALLSYSTNAKTIL